MKVLFIAAILGTALLLGSCTTDYLVTDSAPDYITRDSLNNSVTTIAAQPIVHPARVISSGNYLFINEPYKGWHIIDNSVTTSPRNVAYITAPGSLDGSVEQGYFYIENSVDLVTLNIANPSQPVVVSRLQDVLPPPAAAHDQMPYQTPSNGLEIINWHDTVVSEVTGGFAG